MGPPGMRIVNENGPDERNPRRGPHRAESVSMTLRRGQTAAFGIMAVGFIVTTGSPSSAATHTQRAATLASAAKVCATRPATTASAVKAKNGPVTTEAREATVLINAAASPSASPSPSPTAAASDSPSPAASTSPSPSSPAPSSPAATTSATPTPSPSPSPTRSPSPSPSPTSSPKPKPKTEQLCALVQPFSGTSIHAGQTASYEIFVWSTSAESSSATVTVSMGNTAHVTSPHFTVCPTAKAATCTVGDLPTNQSEALLAAVRVRDAAPVGEKIKLTATVKASKADSFNDAATVDVVAASTATSSGSGSSSSTSSSIGDSLPPGISLPDGS